MEWSGGHFWQFLGIFGVSGNSKNNKNVLIMPPEVVWRPFSANWGHSRGHFEWSGGKKKLIFCIFGIFSIFVFSFSGRSENNKNALIRPQEVIGSGLEAIFGKLGSFSVFPEIGKIRKMF